MAKPRVTITLGGSGKVVKMKDDIKVDHGRIRGPKRFLRDNPWSNGGAHNFMSRSSNKRLREDRAEWRSGSSRGQGSRIAGIDLRSRLIWKRQHHHFGSGLDEHRKRNSGKLSKYTRQPQNLSKHPHRLGPNRINNLSQKAQSGITDGFHVYSLKNMDGSRGFASMPHIIPTSLARAGPLFSINGDFYPSREIGPVPFREKAIAARPVTYGAPMSSIIHSRPHDEELFTVATLLNSLGLGKYAINFTAEEVDMTALRQMRDRDLKELGIPMGPRKKLLLALTPPSKRHLSRMRL